MRYEIGQVLKKDQVMKLVFEKCSLPKQILGRHLVAGGQMIAAYHPNAVRMRLLAEDGSIYEMDMVERQPVFALFLPHRDQFVYRLEMYLRGGEKIIHYDPYSFPCQITEKEEQEFLRGRWRNAYRKMGCHPMVLDGVSGMYFAVWAPHVQCVSLVGDFNHWDGRLCPMNRMEHSDIYEIFLPEVNEGIRYQYEVKDMQGRSRRVADPYGVASEFDNTSKMLNVKTFLWEDGGWMARRKRVDRKNSPMVICSIENRNLEEIASVPADVFTHVLISKKSGSNMPGYRGYSDVGDFFVPPVGEKDPDEFRRIVQKAHLKGIGVLLEVSLESIPCEKPEVTVFLLSNLLFWIQEYHIDGFVFGDQAGDCRSWKDRFNYIELKNESDKKEISLDAERRRAVLRQAMGMIREEDPGVIIISDEQNLHKTDGSISAEEDKLFDFFFNYNIKWNLDEYLSLDCIGRQKDHFKLTLPLQKSGLERSLLLLDYKNMNNLYQTSIDKSKEVYYDMLSEAKLSYAFLAGIPGKKILSDDIKNVEMKDYLYNLLEMYHTYPALYGCEEGEQIFEWVNGMDAISSVVSFIRRSPISEEHFLFICNFSTETWFSYRVGVPSFGKYTLLMSSDAEEFGGKGRFVNQHPVVTTQPCDFRPYSMTVSLPPESALIFGYGPGFTVFSRDKKERCEKR